MDKYIGWGKFTPSPKIGLRKSRKIVKRRGLFLHFNAALLPLMLGEASLDIKQWFRAGTGGFSPKYLSVWQDLMKSVPIFRPALITVRSDVNSSVCLSIRDTSSHTSHCLIFRISTIKLAYYEPFEMHYADIPGKKVAVQICAKWFQIGPDWDLTTIFEIASLHFANFAYHTTPFPRISACA